MLKDEAIRAAHVSYHFIWRRVLDPASKLPWKLCRGDIAANIQEIIDMATPPDEPVSNNIWELSRKDFPVSQLTMVVDLLGECPWSSLPAEQQHASVSLLHRHHPDYGLEQLVSRALLHQAVRLLPHPSKIEKKIAMCIRKLQKIDDRVPDRVTGSHMLVHALVKVVKGRKDRTVGIGNDVTPP